MNERAPLSKHRTVLKTFRFSEDLMLQLDREATEEGTTINALVSSIITHHQEWDVKAGRFGYVGMCKTLFNAIVEGLDEATLERIGREVMPEVWQEKAKFWFQESSPDRVLDFLSLESRHFPYAQLGMRRADTKVSIVLHHELNTKWSLALKVGLNELVKKLYRTQPMISIEGSTITADFSVPEPNRPI